MSDEEFQEVMRPTGLARLALVNAIRLSFGEKQGTITKWLGGALANH